MFGSEPLQLSEQRFSDVAEYERVRFNFCKQMELQHELFDDPITGFIRRVADQYILDIEPIDPKLRDTSQH